MAVDDEKIAHPNPLLRASILSKSFFWWLKDIVWYGKTHSLVAKDLYDTIPDDLSDPLSCELEAAWTKEVNKASKMNRKPSLWRVITKIYLSDFIKFTPLYICYTSIQISQPLFLRMVMAYFRQNSTITPQWAYITATIFIGSMILPTVFMCHGLYQFNRLGMRARIACTSLIYKKMIRLPSSTSRTKENSIISLLTIDVAKFELLFTYASFMFIVPVQLLVILWIISESVGIVAASVAIGLLILQTLPLQAIYSKLTLKFRAKQATRTDYRVSLIGEIMTGIKAIKMYVWETHLEKLVYSARELEIANYRKISYLTSVVWSFTAIAHRPCIFAIILISTLGHDIALTVDVILPVTQHLFIIRKGISSFFFFAVRSMTDMRVSMKRIQDFLLLQEVNKLSIEGNEVREGDAQEVISVESVTASWDGISSFFENFSIEFASKNFYAIVGSVGSGKSSLLKLILGDLQPASGKIYTRGRVSYASQEPWLFNGSVKENILFGERCDKERYEKVIDACALSEDFEQLPDGDETLVGDRGANLSGGQCARVNLARAVYREADTYLFDDPLAAVDKSVAKKIMQDCMNGLLVNKTRILVTHNIHQLDGVKEIILLEEGRVEFRGNMREFQQRHEYASQMEHKESEMSQETTKSVLTNKLKNVDKQIITNKSKDIKETNELIPKENPEISVYLKYTEAGGWGVVSIVILTSILFLISMSSFDLGLGAWTNYNNTSLENGIGNNSTDLIEDPSELNSSIMMKIITFGSLVTLIICASFLQTFSLYKFALNASKNIHNSVFSRLMMATLQFFEANSSGRILNRFSEDTGIIDNILPQTLSEAALSIFLIVAALLSAIIANWWILIFSTMSMIVSLLIVKIYVRIIQKCKKLSGSARSPILAFAASSLAGVTTIRACKAEDIVCTDFNSRQDRFTAAQFLTVALSQAFSLWIEVINIVFPASITYLCVFLKRDDTREGYVGLSLMQLLTITGLMSLLMKQIAEVFAQMISVERMLQFTTLEQETIIEDESGLQLPSTWPGKGEITFEHLYLRYFRDSEPVLWDLNFTVEPGSKVGIVGRTGAGKSSLISALFRFAKFDGALLIDGIDTKKVDLHKLRAKISIIPQQPVLFKSSLRKNLDPADKFDDATLWSALEGVELKNIFNSLELPIEKGGSNLSMGQRQLLCLARAIVNKNKILVLDEATANVDSATDALIQATIRRRFKECTVLTIAHRLDTIMDNDKILVMDSGRMVEYDHPFILMQQTDSYFFKMVQNMGESAMQHFRRIAKQAYENSETHDG